MEITLYSTNCPKCRILERQLKMKKINFETNTSIEEMESLGITSAPALKVGDEIFDYQKSLEWVLKNN